MSNVERQRKFRESHPGYRNRFRLPRSKSRPMFGEPVQPLATVESTPAQPEPTEVRPEPTDVRREPTEVRHEPTLFDPFPPFELKQEEKPIDLHLAGLAI